MPFTAIDNHRKCVTVGSGLLKNETTESYIWLLQAFKKAFVRSPKIIVTDQDGAMRNAVAEVLPDSKHRLCMWHIMQKLPAKVSPVIFVFLSIKLCLLSLVILYCFLLSSVFGCFLYHL